MDKNKSDKQTDQVKHGQTQNQGIRKNEPTANTRSTEQLRQESRVKAKAQTGQEAHRSSADSPQNVSSQSNASEKNITNQDEQRQVTNSGESNNPMGEEETEGDRQREARLKPYKNAGDDSGHTEKKSATMK